MADNHKKPTVEELEAENARILAELETPDETKPSEPAPSEPAPSEPIPSEPAPSEPAPSEPAPSTPDETKKHLAESTKEAQRLYRNNAKINQAITDADSLPEPTADELQQEYSDWELMSDTEKRLAKEVLINKRFREVVRSAASEQKKVDDWGDKISTYAEDPKTLIKYSDLEGKQEAFKQFAGDKKLVGSDFDMLVSSFLYDLSTKKVSHKGQKMFETGIGGPNEKSKPKSDKISVEESNNLRETEYSKYRQLLKEGKISEEIV